MTVKVISKTFDLHAGLEVIVLEDGLGRKHHLSIAVLTGDEPPDVEAEIEKAKREMADQEKRLVAHKKRRGYK